MFVNGIFIVIIIIIKNVCHIVYIAYEYDMTSPYI